MKAAGIAIDRTSPVALNRQLACALREAIRSGAMEPGERIFSTRELRTHLGLSRNTIADAFEQLQAEGYLITVRGVGTFVAGFQKQRSLPRKAPAFASVRTSRTAEESLKACGLALNLHETRPFRPGVPALDLFPAAQFKRCFKSEDWNADFWDYPDPQGYEPLRGEIARRLRQTRGIECSADSVFVTSGAQAAFWLLTQTLLNPGETVIVEDPGYPNVRAAFAARRANIVAVPVDEAGIDVSAFGRRPAKLAYVTPSHQYPTGAVLSLERRFALLEWSQRYGGWIVEDDYDSEFNYTGRPQPALYGLSQGSRVIYAGTFSKVLAPSLRVSYLVVPDPLRAQLRAVQLVAGSYPGTPVQAALARFMQAGLFSRHVTKMRKVYDERRQAAAGALCRHGAFAIHDSRAGLHFIAELPPDVGDARVSRRAAQAGLIVPALSSYYYGAARRNGLVIGYAATAPARARRAVEVLHGFT